MNDPKRKKRHREKQRRRAVTAKEHPLVTIAQYGPDDHTITKVVASLFRHKRDRGTDLKRWVGTDITESPTFRKELPDYIKKARARKIVMTRGVIGCIHEEEKDYPKGQECPFCPFWRGRDRWAHADPVVMHVSAFEDDKPWPG